MIDWQAPSEILTTGIDTTDVKVFCILQVPPVDTDDEQVLGLLVESFLLSGRVTNVTSLIAFHPQYLESFLKTEFFMFKGEGPLPFDWRCYIAIMVRQAEIYYESMKLSKMP